MARYKNAEGYPDPTVCNALENIESQERLNRVIRKIKSICEANDFELIARIELYDLKTGRVYK